VLGILSPDTAESSYVAGAISRDVSELAGIAAASARSIRGCVAHDGHVRAGRSSGGEHEAKGRVVAASLACGLRDELGHRGGAPARFAAGTVETGDASSERWAFELADFTHALRGRPAAIDPCRALAFRVERI